MNLLGYLKKQALLVSSDLSRLEHMSPLICSPCSNKMYSGFLNSGSKRQCNLERNSGELEQHRYLYLQPIDSVWEKQIDLERK